MQIGLFLFRKVLEEQHLQLGILKDLFRCRTRVLDLGSISQNAKRFESHAILIHQIAREQFLTQIDTRSLLFTSRNGRNHTSELLLETGRTTSILSLACCCFVSHQNGFLELLAIGLHTNGASLLALHLHNDSSVLVLPKLNGKVETGIGGTNHTRHGTIIVAMNGLMLHEIRNALGNQFEGMFLSKGNCGSFQWMVNWNGLNRVDLPGKLGVAVGGGGTNRVVCG
mmetsp:Transcript_20857/g.51212  ORF Transcript_20857/g.51212 Transcript_20857/m.51212 type:complete len:226 (+) Transcript_20857:941-1618(+)